MSLHLINKIAWDIHRLNNLQNVSIFMLIDEMSNKYGINANLIMLQLKKMYPYYKDILDWVESLQKKKRSFTSNKTVKKVVKTKIKKVKLRPRR